MAEINLGDFPFYGGVSIEDQSIYLGNNRFFRIVSQRDNDSTIGVMYETTDVFDNGAELTQMCSEVLYAGIAYVSIKTALLGDGRIAVFGKKYNTNAYDAFTIQYDEENNTFISSDEPTYLSKNYLDIANSQYITLQPYEQNTVFLVATNTNIRSNFIKVEFNETIVSTTIDIHSDGTYYDPPHGYASTQSINIVDDNIYFRRTSTSYGHGYLYNITSDYFDPSYYSYYPHVCKLAESKYVIVSYGGNSGEIVYSLKTSPPDRETLIDGPYSKFIPSVQTEGLVNSDPGRVLETFKLDDQHLIIFNKPGNNSSFSNNVYARVVKIIDENYAYVSENSNGTTGVIVTSNYNEDYIAMSSFYNGKIINRIDAQRFYIQTDTNSFEFFTLAV